MCIRDREYTSRFLLPFRLMDKALQIYQKQGLAVLEDGRWRLTPKGLLLSNQIIGTLLEVQERTAPAARKR